MKLIRWWIISLNIASRWSSTLCLTWGTSSTRRRCDKYVWLKGAFCVLISVIVTGKLSHICSQMTGVQSKMHPVYSTWDHCCHHNKYSTEITNGYKKIFNAGYQYQSALCPQYGSLMIYETVWIRWIPQLILYDEIWKYDGKLFPSNFTTPCNVWGIGWPRAIQEVM